MRKINQLMEEAIEELNNQQSNYNKLENVPVEKLNSEGSKLDSLGLLTFINIIEEKMSNEGIKIDLMGILMEGDPNGVMATVGSFTKFLEEKMKDLK